MSALMGRRNDIKSRQVAKSAPSTPSGGRRVLVALPYSHISQRKLGGIFRYVCESSGWELNIMPNGSLLTPEAFRVIEQEGVDGVVVSADGVELALAEIAKTRIPTVLIGQTFFPRATDVAFVHTDETAIGRDAALFFLRDAHWNSFGYVHSRAPGTWDTARAKAFRATLAKHAAACREFPDPDHLGARRSEARLADWLAELPRPVAILAAEDYCAYRVLNACKKAGLRVPQDVAVVGVGNTAAICENAVPSLTSLEPDYELQGYLAARHLDKIMCAKRPQKEEHVYCGVKRIVARESAPGTNPHAGLLVQKALAYIRANACRGIGAHDVVSHLRVSRSLADRRFREVLGTTILGTILGVRLEQTRRSLLATEDAIAAICARCGWRSENHPKKLFREKYGMSMRDYRNANRREVPK